MSRDQPARRRIVIETPSGRHRTTSRYSPPGEGTRERWVALSVIAAATLATFLALLITSRPYNPMNSTVEPQQSVPLSGMQPSPKNSPTPTPSATRAATKSPEVAEGEVAAVPDDAAIQAQIGKVISSDPTLSGLDVSTMVNDGKVTIVGAVGSAELKQRVERAIRSVKGIQAIDNQLVITEATPSE